MSFIDFVPAGSCLLSHTATRVAALAHQDFRKVSVILPTSRLGHFLLGALASQQGAILPPKLHTLAGFFRAVDLEVAGETPQTPETLAPAAMGLWLKTLLAPDPKARGTKRFRYVQPHHSGELMVFYKELIEGGQWESWFEALKEYVAEECYHHPEHLDSVMARFEEVHQALSQHRSQLSEHGLMASVDAEAARAERVAEAIAAGVLDGQSIVVAGVTTMAPSWLPVMAALAQHHQDTLVIMPEPPALMSGEEPLAPLLAALGHPPKKEPKTAPNTEPKPTTWQPSPRPAEASVMVETEDAVAEVAFVAEAVTNLLASGELTPAQIAVLVPSESHYSGIVATGLTGFPLNLAIAQPLSAAVLGTWWQCLTASLAKPYEPLALYHALRQPLTIRLLELLAKQEGLPSDEWPEPQAFNAGFWHRVYEQLTAISPLPERLSIEQFSEAITARSAELGKLWQPVAMGYSQLVAACRDESLFTPLRSWLSLVFHQAMPPALRNAPLEQSAFDQIDQLLASLEHSPPGRPPGLTELWAHINEQSQSMTIRVTGEPMAGVQVLSLAEARWLPVQVAFVLGCNEGFFPRGLPSDELITDGMKKRLGMKGWQGLEAMEDLSFSLLTARVPRVYLCRPLTFAGEETVPSRFVEQLLGQGHHPLVRWTGDELPTMPKDRPADGPAAAALGKVPASWQDGWLQSVSPTSVDKYLSCPYRFALDSMPLKMLRSPYEDLSRQEQGVILHRVFEEFHQGSEALPPLPGRLAEHEAEQVMTDRFRQLLSHHLGEGYDGTPDGVQLLTVGIPRYIAHLLSVGESQGGIIHLPGGESEREFAPGGKRDDQPVVIGLGSEPRQLRGQVDRIDNLATGTLITDFKRDGIPAPSRAVSAQLVLYAKGLEAAGQGNLDEMILGYWSILKGEWQVVAAGEAIRDFALERGLVKKSTPTVAELWQQLNGEFAAQEERVSAEGRYFAMDDNCGFCDYEALCRRRDPGTAFAQEISS